MDLNQLTLEHFTEADIAAMRKIMLQMLQNEDAVGAATDKTDVRTKGCTIHFTYERQGTVTIDNTGSSNRFAMITLQAPELLFAALTKLFAVDDDDLDQLREVYKRELA